MLKNKNISIMIFTEGTILGPDSIFHHFKHASYVPIKNSVNKIKSWEEQGAEIIYFTSRKRKMDVENISGILLKYNFPKGQLYYRDKGQKYNDIIEMVKPDILIEDDCKSIGGKWQMCITYVKPEVKEKIKSVVVKEFKGIDHLPRLISDLLTY
ncbi:MAG: hypothetical protein ACM3X7_05480 [Solirubrobacterales bacterium]